MTQRIIPLAECPQFSDVCAAWAFGQWGSQRGGSLERTRQRFAQCAQPSEDYTTLLAIEDERPLGMASLWPSDDHHRMDLSPWLAGVFVHPDHRRQGIAQRLEAAIVLLARQRNHPVLHLITDKSEALYAVWGWQTIERRRQYDGEVVVMEKKLG
ncbi:MAG: GNAT family N-acetyltransferase [Serratia liquefaciens]|jgi:GNAT superfamily N-acetyltransferase|nr:GNAT family N-acetyltransferase [Serratia liquefaciens]MCH4230901.1 GNAT family N-acetyltransferase [Serratia liquefaciens]MCH4260942.1 GNAT family N-acetyltransferase [Serratia liquefaciens]MCI1212518.1 GNAT family N-acetyltransferase [Serratia liquefaciens]MCI1233383.1 GNAT family N-acetyltransferase [Serratia liquefaciens]